MMMVIVGRISAMLVVSMIVAVCMSVVVIVIAIRSVNVIRVIMIVRCIRMLVSEELRIDVENGVQIEATDVNNLLEISLTKIDWLH